MTQTSTLAYTSETNKRDVDHREDNDTFDFLVNPRDYIQWDYCQVCSRSTDHTGEHDDLMEQGKVDYRNDEDGNVVRVFGRDFNGELLTKAEVDASYAILDANLQDVYRSWEEAPLA